MLFLNQITVNGQTSFVLVDSNNKPVQLPQGKPSNSEVCSVIGYLMLTFLLFCRHAWTEGCKLDRDKRIWYLSPMRAAKVQASLRIRAVSPEPSLLAHSSSESRGTFRQKTRSLAPLNGWACAVKICHDGMLEDTNSLDAAQFMFVFVCLPFNINAMA